MVAAEIECAPLVDRGHDPRTVREVALADLAAAPEGEPLEQVRAEPVMHGNQRPVGCDPLDPHEERVARRGVGEDGVDRVATARADPHDLDPVGLALEEDLLDRQHVARLAALGFSELTMPPPLAEQPADEDAQREE